eukprot:11211113-Lingulodinium_polyedra.AAC.1
MFARVLLWGPSVALSMLFDGCNTVWMLVGGRCVAESMLRECVVAERWWLCGRCALALDAV